MRWVAAALVLAAGAAAAAEPPPAARKLRLLTGAARAISHALSASRDTALMGLAITPYSVLTAGADVAVVELDLAPVALRFGFFGLIELESDRPFSGRSPDFIPRENSAFWRAHGGYSTALDLVELGPRLLGAGGKLEATLSLRHESEHFTGSPSGDTPRFQDYPHIGNFVMADVAARIPAGPLDVELRLQTKVFLGGRSYQVGPGADAIVRWRLSDRVQPFSALFGEVLVGADTVLEDGRAARVPDDWMVRNLTGVLLPGRLGDVQVFSAVEIGHGKGLNVFKKELRWGGGVRLAF